MCGNWACFVPCFPGIFLTFYVIFINISLWGTGLRTLRNNGKLERKWEVKKRSAEFELLTSRSRGKCSTAALQRRPHLCQSIHFIKPRSFFFIFSRKWRPCRESGQRINGSDRKHRIRQKSGAGESFRDGWQRRRQRGFEPGLGSAEARSSSRNGRNSSGPVRKISGLRNPELVAGDGPKERYDFFYRDSLG